MHLISHLGRVQFVLIGTLSGEIGRYPLLRFDLAVKTACKESAVKSDQTLVQCLVTLSLKGG